MKNVFALFIFIGSVLGMAGSIASQHPQDRFCPYVGMELQFLHLQNKSNLPLERMKDLIPNPRVLLGLQLGAPFAVELGIGPSVNTPQLIRNGSSPVFVRKPKDRFKITNPALLNVTQTVRIDRNSLSFLGFYPHNLIGNLRLMGMVAVNDAKLSVYELIHAARYVSEKANYFSKNKIIYSVGIGLQYPLHENLLLRSMVEYLPLSSLSTSLRCIECDKYSDVSALTLKNTFNYRVGLCFIF